MPIHKTDLENNLVMTLLAGVGFNNLAQIDVITSIVLNVCLIGVAIITAYKKLKK